MGDQQPTLIEVAAGVYQIAGLRVGQAYLYQEHDRLTLIDTGLAGEARYILDAIAALGRRPVDLDQIVISHCHADHTGSLAKLVERTDAQVLVHALDAPVVRGEEQVLEAQISEAERPFFEQITPTVPPAPPARVDRELQDGDEVDVGGPARVVHVPGHTPGSIALFVPSRRALFTGNTVASIEGKPILGPFNVDPAQAARSLARLAELDFEVACFGHGPALARDASTALRQLAERLGSGRAAGR